MKLLNVHHLGISVSDIERSLAFYSGVLQMTVKMRREITTPWVGLVNGTPGAVLQVAFLEAPGLKVELLQFAPGAAPLDPQPDQPGAAHLTFMVEDADLAYSQLSEDGVRFVSAPQTNTDGPNAGSKVVYMLDPDGFRIELVQAPPGRAQYP